ARGVAGDAKWEEAFRSVEGRLPDLAEFKGHLADGPATLADWFAASEAASRTVGMASVYAYMFYAVDSTDEAASARIDRVRGLSSRLEAAMSFARPELLAIGAKRLKEWTAEEPRLAGYEHYFDVLELARGHVRDEEVEE